MGQDEEATLRTLAAHLNLFHTAIAQHHGRFVNSAGDSVLAEFASVVEAVNCAVEVQAALKSENVNYPPERRMEFRIGVNLGDVMVEGEQIYGDGVNVAARLESLAEPGGIYISDTVHTQVRDKLALAYEDVGEQTVKNIARPVHVWRVLLDGAAPSRLVTRSLPQRYRRVGGWSFAGLAIAIATIMIVQRVSLKSPKVSASNPPAQSPALALPDKPSIAVLPFTNMSEDREQEYFSDGITDDLITDLSRLPGLFVIARNSTFTYKGKATSLQNVGKELGVKYVLEGSVRKAGDQVRVTVQLADATTGAELWAERYDRPLRDVFALQDEIVRRIVTTLNLQIALSRQGYLIPRSTESLEAYDDLLRGMEQFLSLTETGNLKARPLLENAIKLDPKYATAYGLLGWNYLMGWVLAFNPDPGGLEQAFRLEQQAVAVDDSLSLAHSALAQIYEMKGQYDQALKEAQRCIALDPNSATAYSSFAMILNTQGRLADALVAIDKAMRLDPQNPEIYLYQKGYAYSLLGRWEEAIAALKQYVVPYPDHLLAHAFLAFDYSYLGDEVAARTEAAEVDRTVALSPNSANGLLWRAFVLNSMGKPVDALVAADHAKRLDPGDRDLYQYQQGRAYTLLGRWEEAIAAIKPFLAHHTDDFWAHAYLAADYVEAGRDDAGKTEAAEVLRLNPQFSVEMLFPIGSLQHKALPAEIDRLRADLHKAGLK